MKREWFHCSNKFLGDAFTPKRRTPQYPSRNEPPVPRLCVCPNVSGCIAARLFARGPVWIYSAIASAVRPTGVWDECITGERWVIAPVEFKLTGIVTRRQIADSVTATLLYLERRRPVSWRIRLCQLDLAAKALGERRPKSALAWAGIMDAESYILEQAEKAGHIRPYETHASAAC